MLDLANRKGKAPGGYQTTLEDERLPFIFMNAVGLDSDVRTLLHEGGHAFHTLACRGEPLSAYRESPLEFCEVASMTMELLGARRLDPFYNAADADRSNRKLLEGIVLILPWIATVDAFQHWIYTHPDHTREERKAAWRDLLDRFGGSSTGRATRRPATIPGTASSISFLYPFYYIEYGIAQLGALQIWQRSLTDRAGAVADYKKALALGGSRPLPELFAAAGIRFDFGDELIASLMETIRSELDKLSPADRALVIGHGHACVIGPERQRRIETSAKTSAGDQSARRRRSQQRGRRPDPNPRRPIAQGDAMGARALDADGLEAAVDRQHGLLATVVDPRQPAGVKGPGDHQVARPVVLDRRDRAVPRDQPGRPRIRRAGTPSSARNQATSRSSERESRSTRARRSAAVRARGATRASGNGSSSSDDRPGAGRGLGRRCDGRSGRARGLASVPAPGPGPESIGANRPGASPDSA